MDNLFKLAQSIFGNIGNNVAQYAQRLQPQQRQPQPFFQGAPMDTLPQQDNIIQQAQKSLFYNPQTNTALPMSPITKLLKIMQDNPQGWIKDPRMEDINLAFAGMTGGLSKVGSSNAINKASNLLNDKSAQGSLKDVKNPRRLDGPLLKDINIDDAGVRLANQGVKFGNKLPKKIIVYRASVSGEGIKPNDFVTASKEYAQRMLESNPQRYKKVVSMEISYSQLAVDPNDLKGLVYRPK